MDKEVNTIKGGKKVKVKYIDAVKEKILQVLLTARSNINQGKTKNKKVSDLVSELKKSLGSILQSETIDLLGRSGIELQQSLIDLKQYILAASTTTWLSRNHPKAIEKSVGGKKIFRVNPKTNKKELDGFAPKFIEDWLGKKIDKEISKLTGRTAQHQIMRRHPKANLKVEQKAFLNKYTKVTKTGTISPIQSKVEGLAYQIASETALEIIVDDFQNNGPLRKASEALAID